MREQVAQGQREFSRRGAEAQRRRKMKRAIVITIMWAVMGAAWGQGVRTDRVAIITNAPAATGHVAEPYEFYRYAGDYYFKDATKTSGQKLALMGVTDHGALTGLGDDDHSIYYNGARLATYVGNAANVNAFAISGDVNGKATIGAHVADAAMHWPRPAQSLTVAQGGTGQYTTIEAALLAAAEIASASNPVEVLVYPGTYAQTGGNPEVEQYVSIRAALPRQVIITGYGFLLDGSNYLSGLKITADEGEAALETAENPTASNPIVVDNCELSNSGTATAILKDGNNTSSGKIRLSNCDFTGDFFAQRTHATSGTTSWQYDWRFENCRFYSTGIVTHGFYITVARRCEFVQCSFIGTAASGDVEFFDVSDTGMLENNRMMIQGSTFFMKGVAAQTFKALSTDGAMFVDLMDSLFDWDLASEGTRYDLYAAGTSQIWVKTTGFITGDLRGTADTATIYATDLQDLQARIVMPKAVWFSGAATTSIIVNPSDGDDQTVMHTTPTGALNEGGKFVGREIDGGALDPAGADATIDIDSTDFSGVAQTNNPAVRGYTVDLPATYGSGEIHSFKGTGNGARVVLNGAGYPLVVESSAGTDWLTVDEAGFANVRQSMRQVFEVRNDCPAGAAGFAAAATSGTGALNNITGAVGHPGQLVQTTGTTATGYATVSLVHHYAIYLGDGVWYYETEVSVPTLSDGTETFGFFTGFLDNAVGTAPVDGVYFYYSNAGTTPNWMCVTVKDSTATSTSSGTAVVAATHYRLGILTNAAASSVGFYIDGVLKVTTTTNIPNNGLWTDRVGAISALIKSAGTTSRTVNVDYVAVSDWLTTAR